MVKAEVKIKRGSVTENANGHGKEIRKSFFLLVNVCVCVTGPKEEKIGHEGKRQKRPLKKNGLEMDSNGLKWTRNGRGMKKNPDSSFFAAPVHFSPLFVHESPFSSIVISGREFSEEE